MQFMYRCLNFLNEINFRARFFSQFPDHIFANWTFLNNSRAQIFANIFIVSLNFMKNFMKKFMKIKSTFRISLTVQGLFSQKT